MSAVSSPVITASPTSSASSQVIAYIRTTGAGSTASVAATFTITSTSFQLGGEIDSGDTLIAMINGGVLSTTVTANEPMDVFSLSSVAEQLTVVIPRPNVEPEAGEQVTATVPATRSCAVAVNVTTAPAALVASTVMSAGRVRTGGVLSSTFTSNEPLVALARASVAEHFTTVVPMANVDPDGGAQTAEMSPSTTSVAVAANVVAAPAGPVASRNMVSGTVSTGGVVSTTVTVNDPPELQLTMVPPSGKAEPDAGTQVPRLAGNVTVAPPGPVASTVMSAGFPEVTTTAKLPNAVLSRESLAEHTTVVGPMANKDPDGGVQLTATSPSTRSAAVAAKVTSAPAAPVEIGRASCRER